MTAVTDTFQRSSVGSNWMPWSWSGAVSFAINLDAAVGGNTTTSGGYWNANGFTANQYSQITVATVPSSGFVGVSVRQAGTGNSGYIGIYFSGTFYIFNENGTTNPPELASTSGTLSNGDILTLTAVGTTIILYQNGTQVLQVTDTTYSSGAPGIVFFNDTSTVSWWSGGNGGLPGVVTIQDGSPDGNGTVSEYVTAYGNGGSAPVVSRYLVPSSPSAAYPHAFLWMLPVEVGQATDYGDPIQTAVTLNAQNTYNLTLIEPGFGINNPWYANNPDSATVQQETFLLNMVTWAQANLATTGEEKHYLIGFSKSGLGGSGILFRNPGVFAAGAFWDFPAGMTHYDGTDPDYPDSPVGGGSEAVYGTDANFIDNYALSSGNVTAWKNASNFGSVNRIWIGGYNTFGGDLAAYDPELTTAGVKHTYASVSASAHNWAPTPGWVGPALAAIIPASSGSGLLMALGII